MIDPLIRCLSKWLTQDEREMVQMGVFMVQYALADYQSKREIEKTNPWVIFAFSDTIAVIRDTCFAHCSEYVIYQNWQNCNHTIGYHWRSFRRNRDAAFNYTIL
jgi:hypothetical protein